MPLGEVTYTVPFWYGNAHIQTMVPSLFRRVPIEKPGRTRFELGDGDFVDFDLYNTGSSHLVILSHGLEGSSHRAYILGMVKTLTVHGFDCLAWNFRGCSGEINRLERWYHSGDVGDLEQLVKYAFQNLGYRSVSLIGFSMGGNITLRFLADSSWGKKITSAVTFSVPCDLQSSAERLAMPQNRIYMLWFLKSLLPKVREKAKRHPHYLSTVDVRRIRTFYDFDNMVTAPLHGFRDAFDYWTRCSSKPIIEEIRVPTLLVNARNDPFLAPECFPEQQAARSRYVHLETPAHGGHVGFAGVSSRESRYWSEQRALEFLTKQT